MKCLKATPVLGLMVLTFYSTMSLAKTIDIFDVAVTVSDKTTQNPLLTAAGIMLFGVDCTSSLTITESEDIQNKEGGYDNKEFSYSSNFSFSKLLGTPQGRTQVPVNLKNRNPKLNVQIYESCSGNVLSTCDKGIYDSNGNYVSTVQVACNKNMSIPLNWSCQIDGEQMKQALTSPLNLECSPPNNLSFYSAFSGNPLYATVINLMNAKQIHLSMIKNRTNVLVENYNCDLKKVDLNHLDSQTQKLIEVRGGVRTKLTSGNSIDFNYSINNGPIMQTTRDSGISNFDILYCMNSPNERELSLKIAPKHQGDEIVKLATVNMSTESSGRPYNIEFESKGFMGFRTLKSKMTFSIAP